MRQRNSNQIRALVSIHDVMPHNLDKIDHCLLQLKHYHINDCYLLVVPGLKWDNNALQRLRQYAAEGHKLVAHGWVHKAGTINSVYHRLHSVLISRGVAEHLCIDASDKMSLMRRSRSWFADNRLPVPEFYVPPAWALGNMATSDLNRTGFRYVETTTGIFDLREGEFHYLPLVGYEADTILRTGCIYLSNLMNLTTNRLLRSKPLRVAIHPDDFELRLSTSLHHLLTNVRSELLNTALTPLRKPTIKEA